MCQLCRAPAFGTVEASNHCSHLWSYFFLNRSRLLSHLKYVVVDEGHAYKGRVFIWPRSIELLRWGWELNEGAARKLLSACAREMPFAAATTMHLVLPSPLYCTGVFGCHTALVLRRLRRLCDRVYHSQVGGCMANNMRAFFWRAIGPVVHVCAIEQLSLALLLQMLVGSSRSFHSHPKPLVPALSLRSPRLQSRPPRSPTPESTPASCWGCET